MGGAPQPHPQGSTASDRYASLIEREHAADLWERGANKRDALAEERDHDADDREHKADSREALADDRERKADDREALADDREQRLDERERALDERARTLGVLFVSMEEQAAASIERSRALVAATRQRLDRREVTVKRQEERRERQQAAIDRASAEGERIRATLVTAALTPHERSKVLRHHALATIEAFAANEDEIARVHDQLAASSPDRRSQYRHIAESARNRARKARDFMRAFTD